MNLHDLIAKELFEKKSLAALVWLIDRGRELESVCAGKECFLSRYNSARYVSVWYGKEEQDFETVEQLIENAVLDSRPFLAAWPDAEITGLC